MRLKVVNPVKATRRGPVKVNPERAKVERKIAGMFVRPPWGTTRGGAGKPIWSKKAVQAWVKGASADDIGRAWDGLVRKKRLVPSLDSRFSGGFEWFTKRNPRSVLCKTCGEPTARGVSVCASCDVQPKRCKAMATNPRRKRRRPYKRRRKYYRRRRNPAPAAGGFLGAVANPKRRSNPKLRGLSGKLGGVLSTAIPIAAGVVISRSLGRVLLKQRDYGTQGALGQMAVAMGLGWAGSSFINKKTGALLASAGVAAAGVRLLQQYYPQIGLALGEAEAYQKSGLLIPAVQAQAALDAQANQFQQQISGWFPENQLDQALNVGHAGLQGDGLGGYYQGDPLSIHNRVW